METDSFTPLKPALNWRVLGLLNLYRILVPLMLMGLYFLGGSHGLVLDTPELPNVEMPYFHFRPDIGVKDFMDGWLSLGGPHHFVTNLGSHGGRWRRLAELLDVELEEL